MRCYRVGNPQLHYVALVKNKTIYRKDDISVLGVYEASKSRTSSTMQRAILH